MKEYIESIIEIILEDVSCHHDMEEPSSDGPGYDDVTYCLDDEKSVIEKCIKAIPARLIERPEITVEFINKKTREFHDELWPEEECGFMCKKQMKIKELLSSLLNELAAKISLIGKEVL